MRDSATVLMFCVLVLLHGLFGNQAHAQWLSMHEDATLTTYTERSELIQMDKFVNVAEMLDYKRKMRNEEGHVFHSVVIKAQYNCPDNRVRIYTIELFEERMARGDVPFGGRPEAGIDIGLAGGDQTEFERTAAVHRPCYLFVFQKFGLVARVRLADDGNQAVGARLHGVLDVHAPLAAVAEHLLLQLLLRSE
jgi:hypothetical protein